MKIDFDIIISDLRTGDPLPISDSDPKPTRLHMPCVNALLADIADESYEQGAKFKSFSIASRIVHGGLIDLDVADIEIIKLRVDRMYGPMIVGQVWNLLEGRA